VPKKSRKVDPTAKILALTLPEPLHQRFLNEASKYLVNGNRNNEKLLFSLMKKYLALSKRKHNGV